MVHTVGSTSSCSSTSSETDVRIFARTPLLGPATERPPWAVRTVKQPPSWLYPVAVLALVITFMVLGALVLRFIENHQKQRNPRKCVECTDVLLDTLWLNSQQMAEDQWKRRARRQLNHWVTTQHDQSLDGPRSKKMDIDGNWSFVDSLYCIFSAVTTIGWGNVAPESEAGRGFLIAYIWLGIPLALIVIGQLGSLVRTVLVFVWKKLMLINDAVCSLRGSCAASRCPNISGRPCCAQCSQRSKSTRGGDVTKSDDDIPIIFLFIFLVVYFVLGALLIQRTESSWSMLDAIYYSHVSFSTIGFGDLVLDENSSLVFFYVYITLGIVLLAICFQIVQDSLDELLNQAVSCLYSVFCPAYVLLAPPVSDTIDGRYRSRKDKRASVVESPRKQRGLIINCA